MKAAINIIKISLIILALVAVLQFATVLFWNGVAQTLVPQQANGSLIYVDGRVVGSELLGQSFTSPGYFHGRPSAVDYAGDESAGSNLGPSSKKLIEDVKKRVEEVRKENNLPPDAPVPADVVTSSASVLDPNISVESAMLQVGRVARERNLPESDVRALVQRYIEPPQYGVLGAEKINVLKLNIALDDMAKARE
jgi:potassium-transporting ATPase KdpC subunit